MRDIAYKGRDVKKETQTSPLGTQTYGKYTIKKVRKKTKFKEEDVSALTLFEISVRHLGK